MPGISFQVDVRRPSRAPPPPPQGEVEVTEEEVEVRLVPARKVVSFGTGADRQTGGMVKRRQTGKMRMAVDDDEPPKRKPGYHARASKAWNAYKPRSSLTEDGKDVDEALHSKLFNRRRSKGSLTASKTPSQSLVPAVASYHESFSLNSPTSTVSWSSGTKFPRNSRRSTVKLGMEEISEGQQKFKMVRQKLLQYPPCLSALEKLGEVARTYDAVSDAQELRTYDQGHLYPEEFVHVMQRKLPVPHTHTPLSPEELGALVKYFDVDDSGRVHWRSFLTEFFKQGQAAKEKKAEQHRAVQSTKSEALAVDPAFTESLKGSSPRHSVLHSSAKRASTAAGAGAGGGGAGGLNASSSSRSSSSSGGGGGGGGSVAGVGGSNYEWKVAFTPAERKKALRRLGEVASTFRRDGSARATGLGLYDNMSVLPAKEFKHLLRVSFNLFLTPPEFCALVSMFDSSKDGSGLVSLPEFRGTFARLGMIVERERVQRGMLERAAAKKQEDRRVKTLLQKTAPPRSSPAIVYPNPAVLGAFGRASPPFSSSSSSSSPPLWSSSSYSHAPQSSQALRSHTHTAAAHSSHGNGCGCYEATSSAAVLVPHRKVSRGDIGTGDSGFGGSAGATSGGFYQQMGQVAPHRKMSREELFSSALDSLVIGDGVGSGSDEDGYPSEQSGSTDTDDSGVEPFVYDRAKDPRNRQPSKLGGVFNSISKVPVPGQSLSKGRKVSLSALNIEV